MLMREPTAPLGCYLTDKITTEKSGIALAKKSTVRSRLIHTSDAEPGLKRIRCGKGFRCVDSQKRAVSAANKARIAALSIPPAWKDVWICQSEYGHIQATGRDARDRKQYIYHPDWMKRRDDSKFSGLHYFGSDLSQLREKIDADMRRRSFCREKVVATIIWLMDRLLLRVGNSAYARANKSFGVTTLCNRHVKDEGASLRLVFTGKSGQNWNLKLSDRRITRIVRSIQELPGQHLFQYVNDEGSYHPVSSQDINDYLQDVMKSEFTSKHFRTWAATVGALDAFQSMELPDSEAAKKRALNQVIDKIAQALGNTRAVCRSAYIHPNVIEHWLEGVLASEIEAVASNRLVAPRLSKAERNTLKWLIVYA